MNQLPIEFADSEPPDCTPPAAKASTVGGPSVVAGLGGAPVPYLERRETSLAKWMVRYFPWLWTFLFMLLVIALESS